MFVAAKANLLLAAGFKVLMPLRDGYSCGLVLLLTPYSSRNCGCCSIGFFFSVTTGMPKLEAVEPLSWPMVGVAASELDAFRLSLKFIFIVGLL